MLSVLLLLVPTVFGQAPAPGNSVNCFDAVQTCVQLQSLGYCGTNMLVRQKCPVSCNACPTPVPTPMPIQTPAGTGGGTPPGPAPSGCDPANPTCCDSVTTCNNFKNAGACQSRPTQVGQICPFTCGMCGAGPVVCSKSALDCYNQQMSCATDLRQAGIQITADALINCVLPKAQQMPADSCCHLFANYQYHCHDKSQVSNCECANYDTYYVWDDLGQPVDGNGVSTCTGKPAGAATFQVQENYFSNMKACDKGSGSKLTNSYTYSWVMDSCNDVLPKGSVQVTCGANPGTLSVIEYSRSGCKGKQGKTKELAPGACVKHKKEALRYNFYVNECGALPTPMPTAAPVAQQAFQTEGEWMAFCRTKTNKKSCAACGGKFKKNKCKLSSKAINKMKCKKLGGEVCAAVGCTADSSGKKTRCSGSPNFAWQG